MQFFFLLSFLAGQIVSLVPVGKWSFLDVFAVSSCIIFFIRHVRHHKTIRHGRLFRSVGLFVLVAAAELLLRMTVMRASVNIPDMLYLMRWIAYAGIYAFVLSDRTQIPWKLILYWSGVTLAVMGLVQLAIYPDLRNLTYLGWDPHFRRVFATLFDPNFAGVVYVLTFLVGLSLGSKKRNRIFLVGGQMTVFAALLLTYSRSSFAAFIFGMIVWSILRRSYAFLSGVVVVFVAFIFLLNGVAEGQNLFRSVSTQARLGSAAVGWNRFVQSPVVGTGFTIAHPDSAYSLPPNRAGNVDTSLLFVLASTGLLGFAAYAVLWKGMGALGFASLKRTSDPVLLSSLAAILVHSMFINSLFYPWVMAWMWILLALTEKELTVGR